MVVCVGTSLQDGIEAILGLLLARTALLPSALQLHISPWLPMCCWEQACSKQSAVHAASVSVTSCCSCAQLHALLYRQPHSPEIQLHAGAENARLPYGLVLCLQQITFIYT